MANEMVKVMSNLHQLKIEVDAIYHYNVQIFSIKDEGTKNASTVKELCAATRSMVLENFVKKTLQKNIEYIYSGSADVYTGEPLFEEKPAPEPNQTRGQINCTNKDGEMGTYIVDAKLVMKYDRQNMPAEFANFLERVFLNLLLAQSFTMVLGKFYNLERMRKSDELPKYFSFVDGFTCTLQALTAGMALQITPIQRVCISDDMLSLPTLVHAILGDGDGEHSDERLTSLDPIEHAKVTKVLRNLNIFTTYTGVKVFHRIDCIAKKGSAYSYRIFNRLVSIVRPTTLVDHFQQKYQLTLRRLPVLLTTRARALPLELCQVDGHAFVPLANLLATTAVRDLDCLHSYTAEDYAGRVQNVIDRLATFRPQLSSAFKLHLGAAPVALKAHELPAPRTLNSVYQGQLPLFAQPVPKASGNVLKFCIYSYDMLIRRNQIHQFGSDLILAAKFFDVNLQMLPPRFFIAQHAFREDTLGGYLNRLISVWKYLQPEVDFLVVVVPKVEEFHLEHIVTSIVKLYSDLVPEFGLPVQCVAAEDVVHPSDDFFLELMPKLNAKLGGKNWILSPSMLHNLHVNLDETMLVGIHMITDEVLFSGRRSSSGNLLAVVGSLDHHLTEYTNLVDIKATEFNVRHSHAANLFHGIGKTVAELVSYFAAKRGNPPRNVVIFRSAESSNEIELLHKEELRLVEQALQEQFNSTVNIVWISVQQHCDHKTCFMLPAAAADQADQAESQCSISNLKIGTVVGKDVLNATWPESFYLVSESPATNNNQLGKATRYVVLVNNIFYNLENIEGLCHALCFNSADRFQSRAIPSPLYYAVLRCQRAKEHMLAEIADREYVNYNPNPEGIMAVRSHHLSERYQPFPREPKLLKLVCTTRSIIQFPENFPDRLYYL